MHNDPHGEAMFHISQMAGSAIWFSGLAENAVLDDGALEYYFFSVLQLLLSTEEPVTHIFTYACTQDAFLTYEESAAYLRDHGLLKEETLLTIFESVARMVLLEDDSGEDEKLSLIHSLAQEAGVSIPDTIDIIDGLRHEYDEAADLNADEFDGMDIILPNPFFARKTGLSPNFSNPKS